VVFDRIENALVYYGLGPGIKAALDYLATIDLESLKPGKHELPNGAYVMVADYQTKPASEKRWEAHRKYIDLQYVVSGVERMGYADISAMASPGDYDEANDITRPEGDGDFLTATAGTFAIFYPWDAHLPGVVAGEPCDVRKVIVKVPLQA
jgi:biofilm protein TabA